MLKNPDKRKIDSVTNEGYSQHRKLQVLVVSLLWCDDSHSCEAVEKRRDNDNGRASAVWLPAASYHLLICATISA